MTVVNGAWRGLFEKIRIVVEDQEFAESKSAHQTGGVPQQKNGQPDDIADEGGFMDIPDSLDDDLPFH